MKVEEKFIVELTKDEAIALKILLGSFSDNDKRTLGLNEGEIKSTSKLFDLLPDDE